jgi:hypothetical protein
MIGNLFSWLLNTALLNKKAQPIKAGLEATLSQKLKLLCLVFHTWSKRRP